MASETPHGLLTLFFLFTITLLYTCFINCCYAAKPLTSSSTHYCPSFDCGNGLRIGYPFWKQSQQPEYCGYQGFDLSCKDNEPIISLSNNLYKVKNFNNSENTFTITYADGLNDPKCPVAPHDVVLDSSRLLMNYTCDGKIIHFFYNCSLYPPSLQDIKCLRFREGKRSYVFLDGAIPEFDWEKYCESIVKDAVIQSKVDLRDDPLAMGFGTALLEGFKLTWKPDSACQSL